ncbi:MAG: RIP metalloprotease RseP [Syntrophomonadaceae bacterium]|nr:RIP metalloprotease RseP [Syntrophomonadaceae bacterium]
MTIIITLLIIAVLILVHEWGHFVTARKIGIPVYEFSLGFGYKLLSVTRDGVEYSLRIFPLGGFVRMAGEEMGDNEDPRGFSNRTPWEKMLVSFSGPFMNFVLAAVVFILIYSAIGIPQPINDPIIGKVMKNNPAAQAGLMEGDRVLSVNDIKVSTWSEFTEQIAANPEGRTLTLDIDRGGQNLILEMVPVKTEGNDKPTIGVISSVKYERQGIIYSIKMGMVQTYTMTIMLLQSLGLLITGGASANDLAGPVGITKLVGEVAQIGGVFVLNFAAFLSINLGLITLLPIPALDGSKIVFSLVEVIRRKPIDPEKEGFINWLGFMFLMLLIVFVTYNDIIRLIKG